jgi:hypothetical protein
MDVNVAVEALSNRDRGDFHLVCRLCELHWRDFEVHVEYEQAGGSGRKGRKLVSVLHRASGRHRTYRGGTGNNWISAFEEDARAYCFTLFARKSPPRVGKAARFGGRS